MTDLKAVQLDTEDKLIVLDQTKLPREEVFLEISDQDALIDAIAKLQVRGAPAIGIAAAYGIYVLAKEKADRDKPQMIAELRGEMEQVKTTRPTAVNLAWAVQRMEQVLADNQARTNEEIIAALRTEAIAIDNEEAAISSAIADLGAPLIKEGMGILTHCNAGWLATSELGTALAPIYLAHQQGRDFRVYCDETRPLLQGARLTTYELMLAGIETTLICDNMAAAMMAEGKIDIIFVGADRVAANGDVANKIGTLPLAVNAAYFGIPFYVCAPSSSFDPSCRQGKDIIIEKREPKEVTSLWYAKPMAPEGVEVENPAFDITPYQLIKGIITEEGIMSFSS